MLMHVSSRKMWVYTINILFESLQNKQQYGTKITGMEAEKKR